MMTTSRHSAAAALSRPIKVEDVTINSIHLRISLRLLGDLKLPICRSILKLLAHNGPLSVTDIFIQLRLPQSSVSDHLAKLRRHKVVSFKKSGRKNSVHIYQINEARIQKINSALNRFFNQNNTQHEA